MKTVLIEKDATGQSPRGLRGAARFAIVLGSMILGVLLGGGGVAEAAVSPTAVTSTAEVDRRCRKCHERIYDTYLKTYMANASGAAADRALPGDFRQTRAGIDYTIAAGREGLTLGYAQSSSGSPTKLSGSERLDYFLGSGHLGTTYLYSRNGYLFESPIAYYNELHGYAMKPGMEDETHMPPGLTLNDSCLRCHMSDVKKADAGTNNHYSGLPFLHTGITCESCHGDADAHVSSQGKQSVVNPTALAPAERDSVCIVCHLEGDTRVERRGKSVVDYRPGEDIRKFMTFFVFAGDANTSRAVSEIEQFQASRCKQMSGAGMSCMTCHEMHAPPTETERVAWYRGKCLSCHTGAQFAAQHHAENPDCTSCHMPKTGATNVAHVAWTDHRIRRIPEPMRQGAQAKTEHAELKSILDEVSDPRDLGLGYYDLVTRGDRAREAVARKLLMQADAADPADVPVLLALGVLAQMDKRNPEAQKYYERVLRVDPSNLTAATNLGPLLAAQGKLRESEQLWSLAFQRNEDQAVLGRNLAIVQCMLGEKEKAEETLRRVLIYGPDQPDVAKTLRGIESGQRECSSTIEAR